MSPFDVVQDCDQKARVEALALYKDMQNVSSRWRPGTGLPYDGMASNRPEITRRLHSTIASAEQKIVAADRRADQQWQHTLALGEAARPELEVRINRSRAFRAWLLAYISGSMDYYLHITDSMIAPTEAMNYIPLGGGEPQTLRAEDAAALLVDWLIKTGFRLLSGL